MTKALVTLLLLTSSMAFANEAADELANRDTFTGERTRAEVQAEMAHARAAGTLNANLYDANKNSQSVESHRSRSEVQAEAVKASHQRVVHQLM
ncbi:DUF4148 domain-containing protein [Ramlibacter tataouinensis]|uniref:DUF4148 domain-containing protein n=1 Tax=Ramlibacter tataouinensis TaxID=94132 RepID=UPI0022F3B51B|nr:DUF4148 domain-containing protein [Ramlibacter tataouinensis]WBY03275.1 DUF4148 domain-containing protein [Ramlibacter tataouinensis]